jgi:hypothetical protein
VSGSKTLCSRRGAGTQRRQAAFVHRFLRAFASSRAVPFHPAFASREAAKAAKSCRAGVPHSPHLSARFIPFRQRQQKHWAHAEAESHFACSPSRLRGFAALRLFLFLPQSTGKSCRTRTPRDRTPGAEHRQTIAHSVSCGFTSGMDPSPGGAADPQARPCPLKRDSSRSVSGSKTLCSRRGAGTQSRQPAFLHRLLRAFASSRAVPFNPAFASREAAKAAKSCRAGRFPLSTPQRETHPVPWAAAKHWARAEAQGRREDRPPSFIVFFASSRLRVQLPSIRLLPHAKPRRPRRVAGVGLPHSPHLSARFIPFRERQQNTVLAQRRRDAEKAGRLPSSSSSRLRVFACGSLQSDFCLTRSREGREELPGGAVPTLHPSARDSSRSVEGSKTLCSRRGAGTRRRQAAFLHRLLCVFASSRAVPFNPAFASREAAKAAKSCRAGYRPPPSPPQRTRPQSPSCRPVLCQMKFGSTRRLWRCEIHFCLNASFVTRSWDLLIRH